MDNDTKQNNNKTDAPMEGLQNSGGRNDAASADVMVAAGNGAAGSTNDSAMPRESPVQKRPQIFCVEENDLVILDSFIVPGIYKKRSAGPTPVKPLANNVLLSPNTQQGRIVPANGPRKFYLFRPKTILPNIRNRLSRNALRHAIFRPMKPSQQGGGSQVSAALPKEDAPLDQVRQASKSPVPASNQSILFFNRKRTDNPPSPHGSSPISYRLLTPADLGLQMPNAGNTQAAPPYPQWQTNLNAPIRKHDSKGPAHNIQLQKRDDIPSDEGPFRTRYGRIIRPTRPHVFSFSRNIPLHLSPQSNDTKQNIQKATEPPESNSTTDLNDVPRQYNPPENAKCPTCHKIFLGRRLQRHFVQQPHHMGLVVETKTEPASTPKNGGQESTASNEDPTLFQFLVAKLKRESLSEDQRAELLINEITDLVDQLHQRSSRLIQNTSGQHVVSQRAARVLGIPEGQYTLDVSAIEAPPEPESTSTNPYEQQSMNATLVSQLSGRCLDYTPLSMSLDDTLTDESAQKLNLSAGGKLLPPSEDTLLRSVGDLVHDNIKKLNESNALQPPAMTSNAEPQVPTTISQYDQANDNAVEAVTMKETTSSEQEPPRTVDFSQFNNNNN